MVTMTVFIRDVRHGDRFVELRREILIKDFPASALVTVAGFARPDIQIEIMPVAVIA
jgi:enamine deaminase RidA (YjgF/YER057c/UK114 family)